MIVVAGVTNKTDTTNIQEFALTRKIEHPGYFKLLLYSEKLKIQVINFKFCFLIVKKNAKNYVKKRICFKYNAYLKLVQSVLTVLLIYFHILVFKTKIIISIIIVVYELNKLLNASN